MVVIVEVTTMMTIVMVFVVKMAVAEMLMEVLVVLVVVRMWSALDPFGKVMYNCMSPLVLQSAHTSHPYTSYPTTYPTTTNTTITHPQNRPPQRLGTVMLNSGTTGREDNDRMQCHVRRCADNLPPITQTHTTPNGRSTIYSPVKENKH